MSDESYYSGPSDIYIPPLDNATVRPPTSGSILPSGGYHDLEQLKKDLQIVKDQSALLFNGCSKELLKYSIKVDATNTQLMDAHNRVYPADESPGYITFDEYKYLLTATDSREVQYVQKYYETEMRGPSGTIALDILILSKAIFAEVERINAFITDYIGDLDETAEFRTVELFQDWTQTAQTLLQKLTQGFKTPINTSIPKSELARLTPELSSNFQALLQSKLNILNKYVTDFMQLFETNWNAPSEQFYKNKLGPALLFQVKVGKTLTDPAVHDTKKYPTLVQEVGASMSGLATQFSVMLTDQLKRNQSFNTYIMGVLNNYVRRDTYKNFIKQLGVTGKTVVNNFTDAASIEQAEAILNALDPLNSTSSSLNASTSVLPSHSDLVGREDADAHTQYLLRDGGSITGLITMTSDAKIDNMRPSQHRHTGYDGTRRIRGEDIEYGTLPDVVVDSTATTPVPTDLSVASMDTTQATRVKVEIGFKVPTVDGIVNYEFQVVKLGASMGGQ